MKNLLAPGHARVLSRLAGARTLLAFDFDGTLAPIVEDRDEAQMRAPTRALFEALCERFPTAVISGRSRRDVAARLGAARVKYVVGNHGLESGRAAPRERAVLNEARARLGALVEAAPGLELEDKRHSLTVHFRRARDQRAAKAVILGALARLGKSVRVVGGKCVFNVVPANAPHKGDALLALRKKEAADLALFVGDDVTDEDVFRLEQPEILSVRVGRSASSAARWYVRGQGELDELLRRLLRLRRGRP